MNPPDAEPVGGGGSDPGDRDVPDADAWEQELDPTDSPGTTSTGYRELPPDAPEADALDQQRDLDGHGDVEPESLPSEANEADVLEDSRGVGGDDDERR